MGVMPRDGGVQCQFMSIMCYIHFLLVNMRIMMAAKYTARIILGEERSNGLVKKNV